MKGRGRYKDILVWVRVRFSFRIKAIINSRASVMATVRDSVWVSINVRVRVMGIVVRYKVLC